ncbi:MAG: CDP-diacylglycerol--glycerol-3-phosphate 3-phosphatidyltransferase [Candidatus Cloacimonetes bacterium]|nr:CDP-diacylglycerol--glycerol-3-phosphate 3-phosphatidyltransferase [Candidatus Cloacimonadota bacterium]
MKRYIPNLLTIIRIVSVPILFWLMFIIRSDRSIFWAMIVFTFASITDYFDGLLARKFRVITNFGKIMDPVADKLLILIALVAIALPPIKLVSIYIVYIILCREVFVSLLRNFYVRRKIYIPANVWGKVKTVFQMLGIIFALVYYTVLSTLVTKYNTQIRSGFQILFWIIAFITILSGLSYLFTANKKTNRKREKDD